MTTDEMRAAYLNWCDKNLSGPAGLEFDEFIAPLVEALEELQDADNGYSSADRNIALKALTAFREKLK